MTADDALFTLHVLPRDPTGAQWVRAHLEAHDHLALCTDRDDGSIAVSGPSSRADEIGGVVREIARAIGAHVRTT